MNHVLYSGPTDRPSREPCAVRCTAKNYSRERPTDRPGRAQRGKKSTVGTDRPTDLAARSAAKIRVGPIDRPTRPRAARRKIEGRDRPTDRPCRAQRGAKFTVGTDRPTDPKQLDQVGRSAPTDRPTRYPPRGRSTNNLLRTALGLYGNG